MAAELKHEVTVALTNEELMNDLGVYFDMVPPQGHHPPSMGEAGDTTTTCSSVCL